MQTLAARFSRLPPLIAVTLFASACGDSATDVNDGPADLTPTTVSVFLTDAPGDVSRVWLEITQVTLVGGGPPVTVLDESTGLIEVTSLIDQAMSLVDGFEVQPTGFTQIRLVIGEAVLETNDGQVFTKDNAVHPEGLETTGNLQCPSCSQSGLKVKFSGSVDVAEGEDAGVLLDFDLSQSFGRQAGQSGRWVMSPVIHAGKVDPDDVRGGGDGRIEIIGQVELGLDSSGSPIEIPACPASEQRSLEDFVPVAIATTLTDDEGQPLIIAGETNQDGTFELKVLQPDTYEMGFLESIDLDDGGPLTWAADVEPASVVVNEGDEEVSGVVYTITSVTCESGG